MCSIVMGNIYIKSMPNTATKVLVLVDFMTIVQQYKAAVSKST